MENLTKFDGELRISTIGFNGEKEEWPEEEEWLKKSFDINRNILSGNDCYRTNERWCFGSVKKGECCICFSWTFDGDEPDADDTFTA